MAFRIIIEEITSVVEYKRDWGIIDSAEVERDSSFYSPGEPKTRIKEVHGYLPDEIPVTKEVRVQRYMQQVEELNIGAVIFAVNNE